MVRNQTTDRVGCMIKRRKDMKRLGFVFFRLFYVKIINKNHKRIQKGYKYTVYWGQDLRYWGGNMKYNILLVEDEQKIAEGIMDYMKGTDAEFTWADDGDKALALVYENEYDMALLDVMLPDEDGLEIVKKLRAMPQTKHLPVMMVTAKTTELDKVRGLDIGADDYMTKPFGIMELLSRVKALLRRSAGAQTKRLEVGNLVLDDERHLVTVKGENCELTFKEYELLKLLMANCGMVLTREVIMERVWGTDFEGESRTLDMHIKTLRQKLGEEGSMIRTVRNVGYLLEND